MKKVSIIADSTCDLSKELLKKYDICTIPLHVYLGEQEYQDGIDITVQQIYNWSDEHKQTPKTSAIAPLAAEEIIQKRLEKTDEVICFSISREMSSSGSIMSMVAEELGVSDRVFVVDSRSLSTGIGLQLIEAAIMAESGMNAKQILEHIEEIKPNVRASFVVDTLTYLHRGGRCTGVAALAGNTLKIHPNISVINGKMLPGKKYRGSMDKVIHSYVRDLTPALIEARRQRVFITHSGCDDFIVKEVKKQLEELDYFDEILITRAGSVISSHCGPGTLGVLFIAK